MNEPRKKLSPEQTAAHFDARWASHFQGIVAAMSPTFLRMLHDERHAGAAANGEAFNAAARELAEETQLEARHWERGPAFFTAPGFCTEYLTVYLATGLRAASADHADDEDLEVVRMTLAEALQAIDRGEIEDAKSIVAILWLARRLGGR